MIPMIGVMIAAYICFRCIETLCLNGSRFSNAAARTVTAVLAVITLMVAGFCGLDLLLSGVGTTTRTSFVPAEGQREVQADSAALERERAEQRRLFEKMNK